ncbi:bile acid:sodium symporter family protein [Leadbettera azotonutricia]|uniref:Bile acid:sodium n=1 Tax=Leadbettera azotonutricia (strain ATCC BAA-888 / DSM 13862 / ZAS-9) TaxID=545695 RepID=F5YGD6_LEAAZ|nr:bile acid:sodium symporter family protein [Leadbettera azotonutricia]AEF83063.1 bile acid:sodium [Leadbettera azotonutricia ZAS-9]
MPSGSKPAEIANGCNRVLERFMPILTPIGVILGMLLPGFFIKLRPFVPWIFGIMTLSGALKLKVRDLGQTARHPLPIIFFLLTARIITPVMVFLLGALFFGSDADTISGYVLIYAAPTAVSGFVWVTIFRGDPALSLGLILLDTLLAPFVVPGTVRLLLGTRIVLDMYGISLSLMYMVVIPTIIGVALNELSRGAAPRIAGPYLTPLAKICMIIVICANVAAVTDQIHFISSRFWIVGAACIFFSVLGFVVGKLAGLLGKFDRGKQVSLFYSVGLHNTSAAMTLGIEFFPGPAALPSVLGIIFQQTIAALMGRVFMGKNPADE